MYEWGMDDFFDGSSSWWGGLERVNLNWNWIDVESIWLMN